MIESIGHAGFPFDKLRKRFTYNEKKKCNYKYYCNFYVYLKIVWNKNTQ